MNTTRRRTTRRQKIYEYLKIKNDFVGLQEIYEYVGANKAGQKTAVRILLGRKKGLNKQFIRHPTRVGYYKAL